jgi:hypothetical protein
VNIVGQSRHQVADLLVLKIAERQFLQMREDLVAQIRLAAAREAVDVHAPAIAKQALQRGGAEDQERVANQRGFAGFRLERAIDAVLDQPWQRDARQIGGDER